MPKRACDECISRKVKCSGSWPCDSCQKTPRKIPCTYLKPVRRRGPKVRRAVVSNGQEISISNTSRTENALSPASAVEEQRGGSRIVSPEERPVSNISASLLQSIVCQYRETSYSVWPVINAAKLLERLEDDARDIGTECLALALCAATMAQLQMPPIMDQDQLVDSSSLAAECLRLRELSSYRERLDKRSLLVSFFLHVYHAKVDRRNSAMMFIQEAISGARLLKLDGNLRIADLADWDDVISNEGIVFTLLWVSERGYAMHLGLDPSYTKPIQLPDAIDGDVYANGLLELARLFAAFDGISFQGRNDKDDSAAVSASRLTETESAISMLSLCTRDRASSRMADYCITKEWMRTIIWQEALSNHLLSSTSYAELMTFDFPARVSRDLLSSLHGLTENDLLPLGRDQLLKCFEVANSLADVVLLMPSSETSSMQLGSSDFCMLYIKSSCLF